MSYFWTILTVVFGIIEAFTSQLVSIWLAGGAFAALIVSLAGVDSVFAQAIVFILVSALFLIFTKPIVGKMRSKTNVRTNADALIGKTAVVNEEIDNLKETGTVKLNGVVWSARSTDQSPVESGAVVTIERIEGVRLIVKNIKES